MIRTRVPHFASASVRCGVCQRRGRALRPCRRAAEPSQTLKGAALDDFDGFISWASANGVRGFGHEDSNACLFVGDEGERGMLAQRKIEKGAVIVEVPLRMGICDHSFDEESNQLMHPSAPWSARLACKLLREMGKGKDSPWHPYFRVLPATVPTPVNWPWDLISQLEYQPAADHLHETHWLIEAAIANLSPASLGESGESLSEEAKDRFRWACSVVHSRTLATAAKGGGVGVRVLLPVVDMFNHAGDEVRNLLSSRASACDNCRWQAVPLNDGKPQEWVLQVTATCDIDDGDELCFSYGERSNDDFFVHYGFVPLRNPRDEVLLFDGVEAALDWFVLESKLPIAFERDNEDALLRGLQRIASQAKADMETRLSAEGTAKVNSDAPPPPTDPRRLAVRAGSFVTPELLSMFTSLAGGSREAAEAAIARRAWALLQSWTQGTLFKGLAILAAHAQAQQNQGGEDSQTRYWQFLLAHYHEAVPRFCNANGVPMDGRAVGVLEDVPSSVDDDGLMRRYQEHYKVAIGSGLGHEQYMLHALMVNKRMILWDVLVQGAGLSTTFPVNNDSD